VKFLFVLYVSRSGSTFLTTNLARCGERLLVLPELDAVGPLVEAGTNCAGSLDSLVSRISADRHWKSLGLDRNDLAAVLALAADKGLKVALEGLGSAVAERRNVAPPDVLVLKRGNQLAYADTLVTALADDCAFLHVYRDPRAVCNSMNRARRVEASRQVMSRGSPLYVARYWNRYLAGVRELSTIATVLEIRYESLIAATSSELSSLLDALSERWCEDLRKDGGATLVEATIHSSERTGIHALAAAKPDDSRTRAHENEMTSFHKRIIEHFCNLEMRRRGYDTGEPLSQGGVVLAYLLHGARMIQYTMQRAVMHALRALRRPAPAARCTSVRTRHTGNPDV